MKPFPVLNAARRSLFKPPLHPLLFMMKVSLRCGAGALAAAARKCWNRMAERSQRAFKPMLPTSHGHVARLTAFKSAFRAASPQARTNCVSISLWYAGDSSTYTACCPLLHMTRRSCSEPLRCCCFQRCCVFQASRTHGTKSAGHYRDIFMRII